MNLIKNKWSNNDIEEFQQYLLTYKDSEKVEWATNMLRTKLPVLCMQIKDMKYIVEEIFKGNYESFLDHMIWEYYENTAINGYIINNINDFNTKKKYLDAYSELCDNWATCDLLIFNVKGYEKQYFDLAQSYIKREKPFIKRIGLSILFNYIKNDEYIERIYEIIDSLNKEEDYYVNMMNAWLLSECFIKRKERTIKYLENNKLNKFTINKAVQKCRESRRVSKEDKDYLLKYKVKL